ncbi:hypothetical protein JQ633_01100 [Bradyrhizobium tropiciagri]|uniref:C1q-like domain-containing protein n=1 Tax=Bradyrhizobium tropiciagri TaxID=312253 RepID=UPI001BA5835C|nr:hypothetical protein [Bradyrhizobium tropiciagri]MBR0868938.1 hypothetical protein [Bradyrhizobium tropiciagri]
MSSQVPEVKLKALANFPASVIGRTGIDVTKEGGKFYLDLDYEKFQITPTVPAQDMPNSYNLIWNEERQDFAKVPFALQASPGVASLGGHTGALAIGDGLTFTGETLEATTGIVYTPPWAGSLPRTLQSIFEESISVLDFIPEEKWAAIFDYTSTDDLHPYLQAAADAAAEKGMVVTVPPGLYCSSAAIVHKSSTTDGFVPGMRWHGTGMTFGNLNVGTIFKVLNSNVSLFSLKQNTVARKYTENSEFFNFTVVQDSAGLSNIAAIELVAAYQVTIHRISALGGPRIVLAQFQPDIDPGLSDVYQCYAVDVDEVFATGCNNWPIEFSQGQSPGAYHIRRAFLTGNAGGGIYLTTGQSIIEQCNLQNNGTFGDGSGGIRFDTAEGPSQVPVLMHNEVQENQNFNFRFTRVHALRMEGNRSIGHLYASTANSADRWSGSTAPVPAGYVARPPVHFIVGGDINQECTLFDIKQTVVRLWESTVTAITIFSFGNADAINYGRITGTDWQIQRDSPPHNNVTLFSSGFDQLPIYAEGQASNLFNVVLASSPILKCVVEATKTAASAISGVVIFDTEARDTHAAYDTTTGIFTVPYSGQYKFKGQIGVPTAAGATGVVLQLINIGAGSAVRESRTWITTDLATATVAFDFTINAIAGDRFQINGSVTGTGRNNVAGALYNFLEIESMV